MCQLLAYNSPDSSARAGYKITAKDSADRELLSVWHVKDFTPWYNRTGWLGVKHKLL